MATKKDKQASETVKALTEQEMHRFDQVGHEIEIIDYKSRLTEQKAKIAKLEVEVATLKISIAESEAAQIKTSRQEKIDAHKKWVSEIQERLGLEPGWGFDPLTGQIV